MSPQQQQRGVALLLIVAAVLVAASASAQDAAEAQRWRGHRPHRRRTAPPPPPPPPSEPRFWIPIPTPTPPAPSSPPPRPPLVCNGTIGPDGVSLASEGMVGGHMECVPAPPPPAPPAPPARCPAHCGCACRKPLPRHRSTTPGGGAECVAPLAPLMTCGAFLTDAEEDTPTPQSECCAGLRAFLSVAARPGNGDRVLRCLCPVILGDVNRSLPTKPVDPVRMMYLPIACGVVLPPQVVYICFTGQTPRLGSRVPALADFN